MEGALGTQTRRSTARDDVQEHGGHREQAVH